MLGVDAVIFLQHQLHRQPVTDRNGMFEYAWCMRAFMQQMPWQNVYRCVGLFETHAVFQVVARQGPFCMLLGKFMQSLLGELQIWPVPEGFADWIFQSNTATKQNGRMVSNSWNPCLCLDLGHFLVTFSFSHGLVSRRRKLFRFVFIASPFLGTDAALPCAAFFLGLLTCCFCLPFAGINISAQQLARCENLQRNSFGDTRNKHV